MECAIGRVRPTRAPSVFDQCGLFAGQLDRGGAGITPPEICDAIRNAATTAGTLINLRN